MRTVYPHVRQLAPRRHETEREIQAIRDSRPPRRRFLRSWGRSSS